MFDTITCPECGFAATVLERFDLDSTDGAVEHLRTSCINRHRFTLRSDDTDSDDTDSDDTDSDDTDSDDTEAATSLGSAWRQSERPSR